MKKLLFLLLSLAVATGASAGINNQQMSKKVQRTEMTKKMAPKFAMKHMVQANPVLAVPVTDQPAGESVFYKRSGECLSVEGGYVEHVSQDGIIELIYAEDNIVWFKNILYNCGDNYGDSYVYGTLSADGTKITVPMGQSIYWSEYYSADVVLSYGTSSVGSNIVWTPDESVTEVVYAIDGNTITLQGCGGAAPSGSDYPEYEYNGLGSVWTDDGTFGGYLEWETVFTFFNAAHMPENLEVAPGATNAYVEWDGFEGEGWNLRWRPYVYNAPTIWNLNGEDPDAIVDEINNGGWMIVDADGDGVNWSLGYGVDDDDYCFQSNSWDSSNGDMTPDNWLITPSVKLEGVLKFSIWGSASWPEKVMPYVCVGEPETLDDFTPLAEEFYTTTGEKTEYTIDLSAFEGQMGRIAFEHTGTTGMYYLKLDDILVGNPDANPLPWNYEYELDATNFTIEGLTPETTYEVQVQAYNADDVTDWTESVLFTTLRNVYMLGGDGQAWDPTQGTVFAYDIANNIYTATINFPDELNYFGFTTALSENNDEGGWAYIEPFRFGAIADEGTDYWYTGEEDFISLTWDAYHAIRIPAGNYKLSVDLENMKLIIEDLNPQPQGLRGDVNLDGDVTIADVTALIDYLLTGDATGLSLDNADCNLDEDVTIGDVTTLIDFLLTGNWPE